VEETLLALTDAAGWPPFTFEEVEEAVNHLSQRTKSVAGSRLSELNRRVRRKMLLTIILSSVLEAKSSREDSTGSDAFKHPGTHKHPILTQATN
jgi:hypothetical protein